MAFEPFEKVALIGLGLIGSSLSHIMRREKLANTISGHARSAETRDRAMQLGLAGYGVRQLFPPHDVRQRR
ncbi:MAG: hypothetical protein AAFW74_06830, partial [Pseudomonadota bacterium]